MINKNQCPIIEEWIANIFKMINKNLTIKNMIIENNCYSDVKKNSKCSLKFNDKDFVGFFIY